MQAQDDELIKLQAELEAAKMTMYQNEDRALKANADAKRHQAERGMLLKRREELFNLQVAAEERVQRAKDELAQLVARAAEQSQGFSSDVAGFMAHFLEVKRAFESTAPSFQSSDEVEQIHAGRALEGIIDGCTVADSTTTGGTPETSVHGGLSPRSDSSSFNRCRKPPRPERLLTGLRQGSELARQVSN